MSEEYISIRAMAAQLKVTKRTIRNWISQRKIPRPIEFSPGAHRFRKSEIDAWLKEKEAKK